MKAYNLRHKLKTFQLLYLIMTSFNTKYANFVYKIVLFSNINAVATALFTSSSFILNVKCVESARQKDFTDVMSFLLHV